MLARYRHRLVAAPSTIAGVVLEAPHDLHQLDCACWLGVGPPSWQLGGTRLSLEPVVATNDYQHLLHLAVHGRVVTEVPPFLAWDLIQSGRLVEVLPHHPLPLQTIRALVADTRLLPPLVRQFLEYVAEALPAALDPHSDG